MEYEEFISKFTRTTELVDMTRYYSNSSKLRYHKHFPLFHLSFFSSIGSLCPRWSARMATRLPQLVERRYLFCDKDDALSCLTLFFFFFFTVCVVQLSYVFYGTHKLDVRCRQFFDQVQELFLTWPEFKVPSNLFFAVFILAIRTLLWFNSNWSWHPLCQCLIAVFFFLIFITLMSQLQDETDERLICARDGIEQYIMQRIAEFAFKSTVDAEGDELLSKRMKLLSFLKPEVRFLHVFLLLQPMENEQMNFLDILCRSGNNFYSHTKPLSKINVDLFSAILII